MPYRPYILYLDQNKWIELAKARNNPDAFPAEYELLTIISEEIQADRLEIPLTSSNIYETHKINNVRRRHDLASMQATLSKGRVFRGRHLRLEVELRDLLRMIHGQSDELRASDWFLSSLFFEAFSENGDERVGHTFSEAYLKLFETNASELLYDYLAETHNEVRKSAVQTFSDGSMELAERIDKRRIQHRDEPISMRRRIYSALLMMDELDLILKFANKAGFQWRSVGDIGKEVGLRIMEDVPTYYIEREIALRLESQPRKVTENDLRDMKSFCTVIPYADEVIAEKQFVNLALQAKLDRKYGTVLGTNLLSFGKRLRS